MSQKIRVTIWNEFARKKKRRSRRSTREVFMPSSGVFVENDATNQAAALDDECRVCPTRCLSTDVFWWGIQPTKR